MRAKNVQNWKGWQRLKKLKVVDKVRGRVDVSKVFDDEGAVRTGKEAVAVWKEHFENVLKGGQEMVEEVHRGEVRSGGGRNGLLSEGITKEEVVWALHKLKMKAATGNDGLTAVMIKREVLVELWWELFNWCWVSGMVPSV